MQEANACDQKALRTRVYVDGYNLYYGCLKGTQHKWLDLLILFEQQILPSSAPYPSVLLPSAVKFFTAKILEKAATAKDSVSSQARYHSALSKLHGNRIKIIEGYYSLTESKARLVDPDTPWPRDCKETLVWKLEEKQSDVNLALHAYHDAMTGEVDQIVIVTNDTDIAPALDLIRKHSAVKIGLVVPVRKQERVPNTSLTDLAHWVRSSIHSRELGASQLPRVIPGRKPTVKPISWYARPDLLEQIIELASLVLPSRAAVFNWMEKPNSYLNGRLPIELVETDDGASEVRSYMETYLRNGMPD